MRPLGVSCLIAAFDEHDSGAPKLIKTEPSGATSEWRGAAVGRKSDKALLDLEGCCDRLGEMGGDDLATSAAAALLRTGVDACEALIMTRREDGTVAEKWLKGSLKEGEVVWEKED
jgi:20S proteasome alpha/beta subunit